MINRPHYSFDTYSTECVSIPNIRTYICIYVYYEHIRVPSFNTSHHSVPPFDLFFSKFFLPAKILSELFVTRSLDQTHAAHSGTGIGSAFIYNGTLIPNSELGHLEIDGFDAEKRAASSVKDNEGLSYEQWAERLQRYYSHVENLFWPDLFVVGGGVSKDAAEFLPLLKIRTKIVAAELENKAGIIGAAHLAQEYHDTRAKRR